MSTPRHLSLLALLCVLVLLSGCGAQAAPTLSAAATLSSPAATATATSLPFPMPTGTATRPPSATPMPAPRVYQVWVPSLSTYPAPDAARSDGEIVRGTTFTILDQEAGWTQLGGPNGEAPTAPQWIRVSTTAYAPLDAPPNLTSTGKVDVYDDPGGESSGYIAAGKVFCVVMVEGDWVKIRTCKSANPTERWIRMDSAFYPEGESTPVPLPPRATRAEDALLTVQDLAKGYVQAGINSETRPGGVLWISNSFFKVDGSPAVNIATEITVAPQAYGPASLAQPSQPLDAPKIGEGSVAYADTLSGQPLVGIEFYQGNALVKLALSGAGQDVSLETAVRLAQTIAGRLPDMLPTPAPLSMLEPLDDAAFAKYFASITLGINSGSGADCTATNSFPLGTEGMCVHMVIKEPVPQNTIAFYNAETHTCFRKYVYLGGTTTGDWWMFKPISDLPAGKYECWVAVRDALVAVLPFEVR